VLGVGRVEGFVPPVVSTAATTGIGTEDLVAAIEDHRRHMGSTGRIQARRAGQMRPTPLSAVVDSFQSWAAEHIDHDQERLDALADGRLTVDAEVRAYLEPYMAGALATKR
jgi:putative protein kinase ArgK-like GTPase of G3E family